MAGRGQHFIPKHFQKPFVIPNGKDQLWMYRRGLPTAKEVSRSNSAKKRDFYSPPSIDGSPTLDDLITDYENYLFPKVDKVRELKSGQMIPSDIIAEVATHLSVRAAFIRGIYTETVSTFFATITDIFQKPENFLDTKIFPTYPAPPKLEKFLLKKIESTEWSKQLGISSRTLARIGYLHLREEKKDLFERASHSLDYLHNSVIANPTDLITESHNEILSQDFSPVSRVQQLNKLDWHVVEHNDASAILPDCVCFGIDCDGNIKPLILLSKDKIETVILPLSPRTLAVGKSNEHCSFDPSEYNQLAARVCFDFFLTSEQQPELLKASPKVGEEIRSDLHKLMIDALSPSQWGLIADDQLDIITDNTVEKVQPKAEHEYAPVSINFIDCADQEKANSIGQHIYHIVNQFLSLKVASFLDGVTFANNYEDALTNLDRGFESNGKLQSYQGENNQGVAMPISVMKDGQYKVRIIARGYIGDLFLSEKEEDYKLALAAITHTLAGAEFLYLQNEKFPSQVLMPITDPLESFLQRNAGSIFSTYYITRNVSHIFETITEQEIKLADKVIHYFQEVKEKRRSYRVDGDLDSFFTITAFKACDLLNDFAKLSASKSLCEKEQPVAVELTTVLTSHQLVNWASLFQQDLSSFYDRLPLWDNYNEIFFTNRHLERWLFMFGVLVELKEDGQIYLHVPLGNDVDYLQNLQCPE